MRTPDRAAIASAVRALLGAATLAALASWAEPASAQSRECARLNTLPPPGFGPYDYRTNKDSVAMVGKFHFDATKQRQALEGDPTIWGGMHYTLRRIPNWPQALYLFGVWEHKMEQSHPKVLRDLALTNDEYMPVKCYFENAMRFAPDDLNVLTAYARVLHVRGQLDEALEAFQKVAERGPESPEAHYNLGLAYYSMKKYAESAQAARRAYELGYPKNDLKKMLARAGHWK